MKSLLQEVEIHMKHDLDHFHFELRYVRGGRASIEMFVRVMVEHNGSLVALNQLAQLSMLNASTVLVQPYDPGTIDVVEDAIRKSGLGLSPIIDGQVIRIPAPPLTEEQRREQIKKAHDLAEQARNAIRQARREGNDKLKKMEKDGEISQEEERRLLNEIQKLHDRYIGEANMALHQKEQQILV